MPKFTEYYTPQEVSRLPRRNRLSPKQRDELFQEYYQILLNQRIDEVKISISQYVNRQQILREYLAEAGKPRDL
jgi:hypothetical protein